MVIKFGKYTVELEKGMLIYKEAQRNKRFNQNFEIRASATRSKTVATTTW
jgi:hypothetical protein